MAHLRRPRSSRAPPPAPDRSDKRSNGTPLANTRTPGKPAREKPGNASSVCSTGMRICPVHREARQAELPLLSPQCRNQLAARSPWTVHRVETGAGCGVVPASTSNIPGSSGYVECIQRPCGAYRGRALTTAVLKTWLGALGDRGQLVLSPGPRLAESTPPSASGPGRTQPQQRRKRWFPAAFPGTIRCCRVRPRRLRGGR